MKILKFVRPLALTFSLSLPLAADSLSGKVLDPHEYKHQEDGRGGKLQNTDSGFVAPQAWDIAGVKWNF